MKLYPMKMCALTILLCLGLVSPAYTLQPPTPEQIKKYQIDGTWEERKKAAFAIGNHKLDPGMAEKVNYKLRYLYNLSRDMSVDEIQEVLAPPPDLQGMPSTGIVKIFVLLIEFNDYSHISPIDDKTTLNDRIFGLKNSGSPDYPYESLRAYYDRSSYGLLDLQGTTFGWYNPGVNRPMPEGPEEETLERETLIKNAINHFDSDGHDFSQYDNDGDGDIDYFAVIWAGEEGEWASFWWGYQADFYDTDYTVDGKQLTKYSWQAESESYPAGSFSPLTLIHETGHALGLPDYYDYDKEIGPDGGVGGLDMMDGNYGDHCAFSKFILDWLTPTVLSSNGSYPGQQLYPSSSNPEALLIMPGTDGSQFDEYFIVEHRKREKNDKELPADGLLIWHVNAELDSSETDYKYDNSYTLFKLLRLMEADGLEQIETWEADADADDFYTPGNSFTPLTSPNSTAYDGSSTGISLSDIELNMAGAMMCDIVIASESCSFSIEPASDSYSSSGGSSSVSVDASLPACSWTTSNNLSWVSLSPTSGTGEGNVTISVSANTGNARTGKITIAGQIFSISQDSDVQGDVYEPNNDSGTATAIGLNTSQAHSIVPVNDTDWLTFTLSSTTDIVIETSGDSGDTELWLYDSGLTQIEYDDDGGTGYFSLIAKSSLTAGTYYIKVGEFGNDSTIASYSISITGSSLPCTYSISSNSGSFTQSGGTATILVDASRSDCSWTTSNTLSWVSLSLSSGTGDSTVTITVTSNDGAARTGSVTIAGQTYSISQAASDTQDDYEPNNSSAEATSIVVNSSQTHSIIPADDLDWFTFTLSRAADIVIETSGVSGDTRLWLYDSALTQIDFDDDSNTGYFSLISRNSLAAGTYYIKIDSYNNDDTIIDYTVSISATNTTSITPIIFLLLGD